ncbi:MAG: pyridoxamine 5'-phosphate oxidase family protein [Burkholderiales bacterium]
MTEPNDVVLPGRDATLQAILASAWALLDRGARDAAEDAHWPVLATVDARDPERPVPDARVLVLRRVAVDARELEVHSDLRAHKLAQLAASPRACVAIHDRNRELQLRLWADVSVHAGDAIARRAWDALGRASRRAYLAPRTPGEPLDAPDLNLPEAFLDRLPEAAESEPGFANFAAIVLRVASLEWLRLGRAGHQRARFDWTAEGACRAAFVRP